MAYCIGFRSLLDMHALQCQTGKVNTHQAYMGNIEGGKPLGKGCIISQNFPVATTFYNTTENLLSDLSKFYLPFVSTVSVSVAICQNFTPPKMIFS